MARASRFSGPGPCRHEERKAAVTQDAGLDIDFDAEQDTDAELAAIQAVAAARTPDTTIEPSELNGKAVPGRTVELKGKRFKIASKVGLMPMLRFSAYADVDTNDPRALGALYQMLRDVIDSGDWRAFEDHAVDSKADADELLDVISKAMQLIAGRPTEPSGASSRGRRAISDGSTGSSSARRGKGSRR
jgi:hypothetical protein